MISAKPNCYRRGRSPGLDGTKLRFFPTQPGPFDDPPPGGNARASGSHRTRGLPRTRCGLRSYVPIGHRRLPGCQPEPLVRDVIRPGLKYPAGSPSDGASETPQPLRARWMASPDGDLLEAKAGDQRAATMILERNGSGSKQGLPACDPGRLNPHRRLPAAKPSSERTSPKAAATHA